MSLPTTATRSIEVAAPPEAVYDLLADVTRMGEWSPECTRCEWQGTPGEVGSRFTGHNRSGPARWSTTAEVLVADRPAEFTFATLHKGSPATRWSYRLEPTAAGGTRLSESFEAISTPWLIAIAERTFVRNRQAQLEAGLDRTLAALKAAAEAGAGTTSST
jgi:uncharacterized protein YndB with AHSA1/START domain